MMITPDGEKAAAQQQQSFGSGSDQSIQASDSAGSTTAPLFSTIPPFAHARFAPDYLVTPVGYIHQSCVHVVPNGSVIHGDERTVYLHGNPWASYPACSYEPLGIVRPLKEHVAPNGTPGLDGGDGWQADISASLVDPDVFGSGSSRQLNVPPLPPSPQAGQNIFFWPGLLPPNGDILQPLLNYVTGVSSCPNGNNCYQINAFYYPWRSGRLAYVTPQQAVSPGDRLSLDSTETSKGVWTLTAFDETTGASATAGVDETSIPAGSTWQLESAVVESFGISTCGEFPASQQIYFGLPVIFQGVPNWNSKAHVDALNLPWVRHDWADGLTPDCQFQEYVGDAVIDFIDR